MATEQPLARDRLRGSPVQAVCVARGRFKEAETDGGNLPALTGCGLCTINDLVKVVKPGFVEMVVAPTPGGAHGPGGRERAVVTQRHVPGSIVKDALGSRIVYVQGIERRL